MIIIMKVLKNTKKYLFLALHKISLNSKIYQVTQANVTAQKQKTKSKFLNNNPRAFMNSHSQ